MESDDSREVIRIAPPKATRRIDIHFCSARVSVCGYDFLNMNNGNIRSFLGTGIRVVKTSGRIGTIWFY